MTDSLTAPERETIFRTSDDDDLVYVFTAQRSMITSLRRNPAYTEVSSGWYGTTAWANFTIPRELFRVGSKRKVAPGTAERARRNFGLSSS